MQPSSSTSLPLRQEHPPLRVSARRGCQQRPSQRSEGLDASPLRQECFRRLRAMVLEDLQIANGVRERVTEPALDPFRRECVEFFAIRFRKIELALPDPCTDYGQIVGD